jgi:hypothetical protein
VDGNGSPLIQHSSREENDDGFIVKVSEAGDGSEWRIIDDGSNGANAFGWLLEARVVFDGRGQGYVSHGEIELLQQKEGFIFFFKEQQLWNHFDQIGDKAGFPS